MNLHAITIKEASNRHPKGESVRHLGFLPFLINDAL